MFTATSLNKAVLSALAAMALLLACGLTSGINEGDPVAGFDVDRENAVVLVGNQPRGLDPATTHSGPGTPIGAIFSGLVTLGTDLKVHPDLAAGWDISADGMTYTFYLNPGATFHSGKPVTARDVIYSWERAADPAIRSGTIETYLGDVVGVDSAVAGKSTTIAGLSALDDHVLQVQLNQPRPTFLSKLTYPVSFVVDRENVIEEGWEHSPNGTGPFKLQEWRDDQILILARYEDHFQSPPHVSQVVYLLGSEIPLTLYEKDQIDLVGVGGSTLEKAQDPNSALYAELRIGATMCTSYVSFNTTSPPFDDPLVRQAFSYAVDRHKLINGLYQGDALPAEGPLPPGMPGFNPDIAGYAFDPQEARALLSRAGYEGGRGFPAVSFITSGYSSVNPLVTALVTMWQETLGVVVEPVLLEPYIYLDELYSGDTGNLFSQGWCADYPDPENFLEVLFHSASQQNLGQYNNPEVDALLEQARLEVNVGKRLAVYGDISQIVIDDAPSIFLVHSISAELVKPHLRNYFLTPIGVAQWHQVTIKR